jgi:glutamine synthetase
MSGNTSRLQAVETITSRLPAAVEKTESLEDIWAIDVFNLEKMEKALSKGAFECIKKTIQTGEAL